MSEYIEISDLNTWLCRICDDIDYDGFDYVLSRMDEIPVADVRENVHGEWKVADGEIFCTKCGYMPEHASLYCPNCGAQMDGGDEE